MESEEQSECSDDLSSATQVSTDSEFAREEPAPAVSLPAITVTEAPPPLLHQHAPPREYLLSRTRSAGGLATKRALELKRLYLLGEPSPPAVRRSDSTSRIDTKLEAVQSTITEFQKLLHPAPTPQRAVVAFQHSELKQIPDIISNLGEASVDLLPKDDSNLVNNRTPDGLKQPNREAIRETIQEIDSDSLSEDSSVTETAPKSVPRVEVHDEGGELIQLDSLMIINIEDKEDKVTTQSTTGPTVVSRESESSESCKDATTLALTETELSDWAAESVVLEDCGLEEDRGMRNLVKSPRTLSGPKVVHDAKNLNAISSHVCGRTSPTELVDYSNALEHFEFADEGDEDPSLSMVVTPRNEGYMEFVDDDYRDYSPVNDRSMNFIERRFSETLFKPLDNAEIKVIETFEVLYNDDAQSNNNLSMNNLENKCIDLVVSTDSESTLIKTPEQELKTPQLLITLEKELSNDDKEDKSSLEQTNSVITETSLDTNGETMSIDIVKDALNSNLASPPLAIYSPVSDINGGFAKPFSFYSIAPPMICRSASENFDSTSPNRCGSASPASPLPCKDVTDRVREIGREREERTEVIKRLVLERLGGNRGVRKGPRRVRASPVSMVPPPVPPPPIFPTPPPPPPPPPDEMELPLCQMPSPQVAPSLSDPELNSSPRRKGFMSNLAELLHRRRAKVSVTFNLFSAVYLKLSTHLLYCRLLNFF